MIIIDNKMMILFYFIKIVSEFNAKMNETTVTFIFSNQDEKSANYKKNLFYSYFVDLNSKHW